MVSPIPLVSFLITLLLAAAVCIQGEEVVKDTDGNPVQGYEQYFIQPVKTKTNKGGGLVPAAVAEPICPLGITQSIPPFQPGLPVSITLRWPEPQQTIVDIGSDVNIEFKSDFWPFCQKLTKFWGVNDSSSASEEPAIIIGTEPINIKNWFQIRTAGKSSYKLTTRSGTVGTIPGPWFGAPELVLTNDTAKTLFVKFKKVEDSTTLATY